MFPYIPYIGWVLEQSHTAIPAKDGVVISSRTDLFSLGEGVQSLFEKE